MVKRSCDDATKANRSLAFFAFRLGRALACKYYGEVADGPAENEQNSGRVDASKVNVWC